MSEAGLSSASVEESAQLSSHQVEETTPTVAPKKAENKEGLYSWLKVPTIHPNLRKMLRSKLVELFNEVPAV